MRRRNKAINRDVPRVGRGYPAPKKEPRPPRRRSKKGGAGPGGRDSERDYLKPLDERGLRKETRAATNLRFRPLERAIGAEIRASKQRGAEVGDWWQNYLTTVSQGQQDTQAAYDAANAATQGQIAQASQLDSANTAKLQQEAAASAALRGTSVDMSGANREAAAQAQRNYLGAAQASNLSALGANQRGYLNEQKRIGVGQRIASGKEEQRREASLRKDRRDTRRERGDYAATKRGELTKREREYLIQRGAFGLDKKEAALAAKQAKREAEGKGSGDPLREAEIRQEQERINAEKRKEKGGGKAGGLTPSERRDARKGWHNGQATLQRMIEAYGAPKSPAAWEELESKIESTEGVSAVQARKIVARYKATLKQKRKKKQGKQKGIPSPTLPGATE